MEPIDWHKPIVLMNGEPAKVCCLDERVLVGWKHFQISVDYSGCIGGVQVVRNRKEKRKLKVRGWVNVYTLAGSEPPYVIGTLYASLEGAKRFGAGAFASIYIDREVEEGEGL